MPNLTVRCNQEFIDTVKSTAETQSMNMSDFVRQAVLHFIDSAQQTQDDVQDNVQDDARQPTISVFQAQVDSLHSQLNTKDDQIQQLHQLIAMGHKERDRLSEQLQHTTVQLEDLTKPQQAWWKRMFGSS